MTSKKHNGIKFLVFGVTDQEHRRLKMEAAIKGKSMAEIVRAAAIRPLTDVPLHLDIVSIQKRAEKHND